MKEKIQKIREKVIEANPEIVELKFGCVVRHGTGERKIVGYAEGVDEYVLWSGTGFEWVVGADIRHVSKEILGRPIRLADVLLAHRGKYVPTQAYSFMTQCYEITNGEKAWNLRKDDLSEQNEETIDFLYSLLS